ncbi:MAG TPA: hypothetical protein VLR89_06075 [Anaerolineaceae bacterium]|nr:hypothetical protein [Anaerolineaceae bacterium]
MKSTRYLVILLLAAVFLSACQGTATLPDPATAVAQTMAAAQGTFVVPQGTVSIETAVAQTIEASSGQPTDITSTEAPIGTKTQAPAVTQGQAGNQEQLLVWAPDGSNTLLDQIKPVADKHNLAAAITTNLTPEAISTKTRLVVTSAPADQVLDMASKAPLTLFMAVNTEIATPPANVYSFNVQGPGKASSHAQNAFVAGFIFGLITPDYRAGVISQSGTPEGLHTQGGFQVGEQYYCGLCNSRNAPVTFYPKSAEISDSQNQAEWMAAADALVDAGVRSVFIQPEVSSQGLVDYLRSKNMLLIGVEGQVGLGQGEGWVATISSTGITLTLEQAVEELLSNGSLPVISEVGLDLINVNREYLSEGKQAYFEFVRRDLVSGLIKPLPFGQ